MLQMISVKLRIIREFYVVKAHSDFDEDVLEILIHYRYITDTWQKTEKETKNKMFDLLTRLIILRAGLSKND